jgi:PAS domain S-box-containing protein
MIGALALVTALLWVSGAQAQIAHVRTITLDDGLPSSEVHDVAQGPDGRIWLATRSGLAVFDGVAWATVPPPEPLRETASTFTEVEVDSQNRVWLASPHARIPLFVREDDGWRHSAPFWRPIDNPVVITCMSVLERPEGVWAAVGTPNGGLAIWDGAHWNAIDTTDGLRDDSVREISVVNERWIVATSSALHWLTPDGTVIQWGVELADAVVAIEPLPAEEDGPQVRVLTRSSIVDIAGGTVSTLLDGLDIAERDGSLVVHRSGTTVAADHTQVIEVPAGTKTPRRLGAENGLEGPGALSLFVDREDSLWIAGRRGATVVISRRFLTFRVAQGLLDNEVTAIGELGAQLVLGHNAGITVADGHTATTYPLQPTHDSEGSTSRVLEIAEGPDPHGPVWIAASSAGLLQLEPDHTLRPVFRSEGSINAVTFDAEGRLWCAGRRIWRRSQDGALENVIRERHPVVRRLVPQDDGTILVATIAGLLVLDTEDRLHEIPSPDVPGAASIYCVHRDRDRALVGTSAGVMVLENGQLSRPRPPLDEVVRPVFAIVEGPDRRIWFGTDDGVYILGRDHDQAQPLRHLTTHHGLAGREVNRDAVAVDRRGHLWIGTDGGLSVYRPQDDREVQLPSVTLRATDVDGQLVDVDKPLSVPAKANTVVFRFLAISFSDWGAVRCRVRLEGFDSEWSEPLPASQRWVRYTNLPPGRYRFHVQASGSSGRWTRPVSSAWLTIRGPVSQRWWFAPALLLALAAVVGLLTLTAARWRHARQLEQEVRERRAAERALASSRASFAGLVDQNTNGIVVTDERGIVVFANPAAAELLTPGAHTHDLTGTQLQPHPSSGQRPIYCQKIDSDEEPQELELSARKIDWHGSPHTLVTVRDVTEQTRTERALRESEERYRNLFERNLAGVFRSTIEGRILECNPAFARIYGYGSVAEAICTPAERFYPTPHDREAMLERLRAAGGQLVNVRRRGRRRDGTTLELLENVALVADADGELTRLEGTLFDVTELRRLEEQLFHAQKMEAVGRLAGGLAHDFNNVLQAFQGVSEQLRAEGDDPPRRHERIDELDGLISRGASLTRQLLLFSRKEPPHTEPLDLCEVIRSSGRLLRRLLPEQISLDLLLAPGQIPVKGDPGQLEQVIVNLAVNAADAMTQSGIITVRARHDNDEAIMEIVDTGCGIHPEEQELVFEPFFTTKSRGEGTGLGLAVVDGIVRLHGGTVALTSEPGNGTTVAITLPMCDALPARVSTPRDSRARAEAGNRPLVLVVEDDDGARVAFERLLRKLGYDPRPAESLAVARTILDTQAVELVLTDLLLPDGHGGDLVAELAVHRPSLPIVCMSGYPDQPIPTVSNGRQPLLLMKPFTSSTLAEALHDALNRP